MDILDLYAQNVDKASDQIDRKAYYIRRMIFELIAKKLGQPTKHSTLGKPEAFKDLLQ